MKVIDLINRLNEFDHELEVNVESEDSTFDITDVFDDAVAVVIEVDVVSE